MPLPLLGLAAGVVARGVATKAGAGMGTRLASGAAANFGVSAIQRQHQNQSTAVHQKKQDTGFSQRIKENPGEAAIGYGYALARGGTMRDQAASQTNALLQSTQFH